MPESDSQPELRGSGGLLAHKFTVEPWRESTDGIRFATCAWTGGSALKVFVSWSKTPSDQYATVVKKWLKYVVQAVEPWSSQEIGKGTLWNNEIVQKLNESTHGIFCVTPENQAEPWLNFEAGALAKSVDGDNMVTPLLFGLNKSQLVGPLANFNATLGTDKEDMFKLASDINEQCPSRLTSEHLTHVFEQEWPDYEARIAGVMSSSPPAEIPERSQENVLEELVSRLRYIERAVDEVGARQRSSDALSVTMGGGKVPLSYYMSRGEGGIGGDVEYTYSDLGKEGVPFPQIVMDAFAAEKIWFHLKQSQLHGPLRIDVKEPLSEESLMRIQSRIYRRLSPGTRLSHVVAEFEGHEYVVM